MVFGGNWGVAMADKKVTLDLRKMIHELERMNRGEIPFDQDYLNELIEGNCSVRIELVAVACSQCNQPPVWVECPECRTVGAAADCFMCDGDGGWFHYPNCDGDGR